ncbi:MAG: leucine-rich repeat domain-containing protein, partial [Campylobacterota bacterium]|nr:leucine-rich repeat domain-containing protein [Campylobacterota bacterium]
MRNKTLSIIPQDKHGLIAQVIDNEVKIVGKLDIPYNSISKITANKTIVTLDKGSKKLLLHNLKGEFLDSYPVRYALAMNIKDDVVYIGGNANDGEVCTILDLSAEDPRLVNLELPVEMSWGKAVDDILIVGNKMMLIDNIVFPKFTFEYDISNPAIPEWRETIELPESRPYENIIKGDMNGDWMIYLSTSSNYRSGDKAHITIQGKQRSHTISSLKENSITDICLVDDRLYALTDIGLGYFDLTEPDIIMESIVFVEHQLVAYRILKIDERHLLLLNKYEYELLDLEHIEIFKGTIKEKYWSYGSLDLSQNGLTSLPTEIKNLENLENLDLSNNNIKTFPETLRRCRKLRYLNLSASGIRKIPSWIEEFEHLEYLNLSSTNIGNSIMASRIKLPKKLRVLNLRYCNLS